jgi:hypothetical protein
MSIEFMRVVLAAVSVQVAVLASCYALAAVLANMSL